MTRVAEIEASRARSSVLLVAGTILVAVNLRFAITSVGPLIDDVRTGLGLSSAAAGLLTTAPLLALGVAAPAAPGLGHRFGPERVVFVCLLLIAAGVALRLPGSVAPLYAGTILAGCGIAVGNV
ncbi:MAG: MFS transporter, partial [Patulibacter sp.]|nr:MFS transporter [Patulibacter sp.]